MKNLFLVALTASFAFACNQPVVKPKANMSDEYAVNLKTAQTFFELFN